MRQILVDAAVSPGRWFSLQLRYFDTIFVDSVRVFLAPPATYQAKSAMISFHSVNFAN